VNGGGQPLLANFSPTQVAFVMRYKKTLCGLSVRHLGLALNVADESVGPESNRFILSILSIVLVRCGVHPRAEEGRIHVGRLDVDET
jgi:hypothetical protein